MNKKTLTAKAVKWSYDHTPTITFRLPSVHFYKPESKIREKSKEGKKGGDKVWMYEEMMKNDDNLESNLLTSSLLKIRSLYKLCRVLLQVVHIEPDVCVEVVPTFKVR